MQDDQGYSSGTAGASIFLTGIQASPTAVLAAALESAVIVAYLVAASRLSGRGRRWGTLATVAFVSGVIVVWVATGSGLAARDDNPTLHVLQHVLLMMVAAPLIVAGRPLTLLCQASPRRVQRRVVRVLRSRAVSWLTSPWLTWPLYFAGMFVYWLCRPVYQATFSDPLLHEASHAAFFSIGVLYWQRLLGDGSGGRLLPHPVRILAVLLTMPLEMVLGVGMTLLTFPLGPGTPVADNRAAGQMFWITAMLCSGLAVGAMSIDWLARDERAAVRGPRELPRSSPTPA